MYAEVAVTRAGDAVKLVLFWQSFAHSKYTVITINTVNTH